MAKVLVVDDVKDNRTLLQFNLEDDGYEVLLAENGQEALDVAAEAEPDVILMDIMMPVMDGIQACRKLKESPDLAQIPVLMVSAKDRIEDVVLGLDAGAMDYISKPLEYSIVAARLRSALRVKEYEDLLRDLNSQLKKAKEEAELALKSRSSFFAMMSHEIRTPITAIMGYSEILAGEEKQNTFDRRQAAERVFSNSRHLLEVINNILDFSKAESGRLEIEWLSCRLPEILREVEGMINIKALEKNLMFGIDISYPIPNFIRTDPTRLKQVLINLCSNAIKFTEEGKVSIEAAYDLSSNSLRLAVRDSGIGMSGEEMNELFQPFSQANSSISRQFGGSGLGLSISKEIVEKLGGEIRVESEKGTGSIFSLELPLEPLAEAKLLHEPATLDVLDSKTSEVGLEGKVLLVEDESLNLHLITYILEALGLKVEIAGDGEAAVEKAIAENFDIILMDMRLPKLDGMSATKILRSSGVKIPIVALTASQDTEELQAMLHAGCNEYLMKPFQRNDFSNCLRKFLSVKIEETEEFDNDDEFESSDQYAELVHHYISRMTERLENLDKCFKQENWEELRREAHNLVSAQLFGFPQVSLLARFIEAQIEVRNRQGIEDLLVRLRREIQGVSP